MARIIDYRRGDIYYIETGGVCVGSEQKPGRPGVIVSNDLGNKHSSNVEVVYLTSQSKRNCPLMSALFAKFRPPLCAKTSRPFRKNDSVHSFVLVLITK